MNTIEFQLAERFLLFFLSHERLVDLPGMHFLTKTGNILLTGCSTDAGSLSFSCGFLLVSIVTTSLFGVTFFIRNRVVEKKINQLISCTKSGKKKLNLIGKAGKIKSIDGERFISIDGKLYSYLTTDKEERTLGSSYTVIDECEDTIVI